MVIKLQMISPSLWPGRAAADGTITDVVAKDRKNIFEYIGKNVLSL